MVLKLTAVFLLLVFHNRRYAIVGSKNGVITHSKVSNSLLRNIILRRPGLAIHKKSFAHTCLTSNLRMNGYSDIDSKVWVEQNLTGIKISVKEYSRADMSTGSVMTLLKVDFV